MRGCFCLASVFRGLSKLTTLVFAVLLLHAPTLLSAPVKMLVTMSTTGTVECYDPATGKHLGSVIRGLSHLAGIATDGNQLLVTTSSSGRMGGVQHYNLSTGKRLGDFISPAKRSAPAVFEAASSLAYHGGDLFVSSYHDGRGRALPIGFWDSSGRGLTIESLIRNNLEPS